MNRKDNMLAWVACCCAILLAVCSVVTLTARRMPAEQATECNTTNFTTEIKTSLANETSISTAEITTKTTTEAVKEEAQIHTKFNNNHKGEKFRITVYTPSSDGGKWGYQTATGAKSEHLKTCAVDPSVIPLGSTVKVGNLVLKAVDVGGGVKGNHIDIFYDGSYSDAMRWASNFGDYSGDVEWVA